MATALEHRNLGDKYRKEGKYNEAIQEFNQAIALEPDGDVYYNQRGITFSNYNRCSEAISDYLESIAIKMKKGVIGREKAVTIGNLGEEFRRIGLHETAIKFLSQAQIEDSSYDWHFLRRAWSHKELGHYYEASLDYEQHRKGKDWSEYIGELIVSLILSHDITKALLLQSRRVYHFHNSEEYCRRGLIFYLLHAYDSAIMDFNSAIGKGGENYIPLAYEYRGKAYFEQGKYNDALVDFNEAIEKQSLLSYNPDWGWYWLRIAETISPYASCMADRLYIERGNCYYKLGEYTEAISDFAKGNALLTNEYFIYSEYDYKKLLQDINIDDANSSPIKCCDNAIIVIEHIRDMVDVYQKAVSPKLKALSQLGKYTGEYENNNFLSESENSVIKERYDYIALLLNEGLNDIKNKIMYLLDDTIEQRRSMLELADNKLSLQLITNVQNSQYPSVDFIAEYLMELLKSELKKIEFILMNEDIANKLITSDIAWKDRAVAHKNRGVEDFKKLCVAESIEVESYNTWYEEWTKKLFMVESMLLPLFKYLLQHDGTNNIVKAEEMIKVIGALEKFKDGIDKFYIEERIGIYQKYAFQAGGELQEKFESEKSMYKITENLQVDLQNVIFSISDDGNREFLIKWSEPVLNINIDELIFFINDKDLKSISENVMSSFMELRKQNFIEFVSDSEAYGEAIKEREREYNSLVFKMRKELMK